MPDDENFTATVKVSCQTILFKIKKQEHLINEGKA